MLFVLAGAARADILIGVAAPMTGAPAEQGREIQAGAEAAIAALNAAGGSGGRKIRIVTADDGCTSAGAVRAAEKLVAASPALVIGHPCSAAAIAAARVYARAPLTFAAIGARHPDLTAKRAGPNIWRLAGRDDGQGETAAAWLAGRVPSRRLAVVHDRTQLARTLANQVLAALAARGITGTVAHGIVAGEKDYGRLVSVLKGSGVEAVYFAGFPSEAVVLLKALRAAGISGPFVGPDSLATAELAGLAAPLLAEVYLTKPDVRHGLAALAGAAIEAWASAAANSAGGPVSLTAAAATRIGSLAFDASGDAQLASFRVVRWNGSVWAAVSTSE